MKGRRMGIAGLIAWYVAGLAVVLSGQGVFAAEALNERMLRLLNSVPFELDIGQ